MNLQGFHPVAAPRRLEGGGMKCRNCGSIAPVAELLAQGFVSCCPERDTRPPDPPAATVAELLARALPVRPPAPPPAAAGPVTHWTVEEAGQWLQPGGLPLNLLRQLGKDCSMVCRIHSLAWIDKPVQYKSWPTERAYTAAVLQEVFAAHPDTRDAYARLNAR